ncbi:MAG: potassium transporter TrkA [Thermoplasmata archaeon]|nr:potassium transporter TrkA [Thermoplasmata archaeon]
MSRRPLRDLLLEMKDTSEYMVDLALTSILFNSREMARHVFELEEKMDRLMVEVKKLAMIAVRTEEDAESLLPILEIAEAAEDISNAAGDIAKLLKYPVEARIPLMEALITPEDTISLVLYPREAPPRTVGSLRVEDHGLRLLALRKRRRWIMEPDDEVLVEPGDLMVVSGPEDGVEALKKWLGEEG